MTGIELRGLLELSTLSVATATTWYRPLAGRLCQVTEYGDELLEVPIGVQTAVSTGSSPGRTVRRWFESHGIGYAGGQQWLDPGQRDQWGERKRIWLVGSPQWGHHGGGRTL